MSDQIEVSSDINGNSTQQIQTKLLKILNKTRLNEPEDSNDGNIVKKFKLSNGIGLEGIYSTLLSHERCKFCEQYLCNVLLYNGHPMNSVEESVVLTDPRLSIFKGDEYGFTDSKDFPTHKITRFSVYDDNGHLCAFDCSLIENNVNLRFSGYVKRIDDESPSIESGLPTHDLGPILEWWVAGYEPSEELAIGFSTEYAEYYLLEPSPEYSILFQIIKQKTKLVKTILLYLTDTVDSDPTYNELVEHIESTGEYESAEEVLIQNAQYVYNQIANLDNNSRPDPDQKPLKEVKCMKTLIKLTNSSITNNIQPISINRKELRRKTLTKAITTNFVREFFEKIFPEQIDNNNKMNLSNKVKCGVYETCQSCDCGECGFCRDMLGFDGNEKLNQNCKNRKYDSVDVQTESETESDFSSDDNPIEIQKIATIPKVCSQKIVPKEIKWQHKSNVLYCNNKCYSSVLIDDIHISTGDFVTLKSDNPSEPPWVAKIIYMYDNPVESFLFHGLLFCRARDTILSGTAAPRELFMVDNCDDLPLGSIIKKAKVNIITIPSNWSQLGGFLIPLSPSEDNGENFYLSKRYEENLSRFVDIDKDELKNSECISCIRKEKRKIFNSPAYNENKQEITWKGDIYAVGSGVFLDPAVYEFDDDLTEQISKPIANDIDETLYPEYYRKSHDKVKSSKNGMSRPFIVGIIEKIVYDKMQISIDVRMFWRPDDTKNLFIASKADLTLVYYTENVITTCFSNVKGKCYVKYSENVENPTKWSLAGPFRFYFEEMFDVVACKFGDAPIVAKRIGIIGKGKGGKKKRTTQLKATIETPPAWDTLNESPLRAMDIFAGCGGLSEGFHQAGICETKWAIEFDAAAAEAFRMNNPKTKVFTDDCNEILKSILSGTGNKKGLPAKSEVEMLIGGPPCQGFSGINRFNAGQYSRFKNSLIATYLSFCEYYRPKYFVLENVANFVTFKKGMILKLTLACLLKMGYQITWGILQAGNYGVPQSRRRLILMAAAPGYELPRYPEPQYAFNTKEYMISFFLDNQKYTNGCNWIQSTPYRAICVRDAISDLPDIANGWNETEMPYDENPLTHFQKLMRNDPNVELVQDHICKEMPPLVSARISRIPTTPGSDWRDLPNMEVKLADGTYTKLLLYPYRSKKQKSTDPPRGVCRCATGGACNTVDRQINTMIPWCLVHTADRNYNWVGLYGRLEWDSYFRTTITNPDPIGKQGRVLHPDQNRVVSVRECARSQGFPDSFKFNGHIMDKYRQIGNAVPPPLACAVGREILGAVIRTTVKNKKNLLAE